jgi:hypothetical protein
MIKNMTIFFTTKMMFASKTFQQLKLPYSIKHPVHTLTLKVEHLSFFTLFFAGNVPEHPGCIPTPKNTFASKKNS